ncbi:MAG: S26 family signal peptidase [Egibacteraceae bacterium]
MLAPETRVPNPWLRIVVVSVAGVAVWVLRPRRVAVSGLSMAPTLLPGERLLIHRTGRLRRGDLVVVADPAAAGRLVVKRVAAAPGQQVTVDGSVLAAGPREVVVLGDNAAHSTDSRDYGPLPTTTIKGRATYRYAPPDRAGRLRRLSRPARDGVAGDRPRPSDGPLTHHIAAPTGLACPPPGEVGSPP